METRQIFTNSPLRNFSYVIYAQGIAYVVDPFYAEQILDFLAQHQLSLRAVINTHEHWDHIRGNSELQKRTGCEIWAHKKAKSLIPGVSRTLDQDDLIEFSDSYALKVLDTPGHTFAHVCLLALHSGQPQGIFSGDTLFNAGVGNCRNGGDAHTLYQTIKTKFHSLPDNTVIYPGHEYWQTNLGFTLSVEPDNDTARQLQLEVEKGSCPLSTISLERQVNVFLRGGAAQKEEFLRLRSLRDKW